MLKDLIQKTFFLFGVNIKKLNDDDRPEKADLTSERDKRARPLAIKLIKFIASKEDLAENIGSDGITKDKIDTYFGKLATEFMDSLTLEEKEGVLLSDYSYAFKIALTPIDQIKDKIETAIDYQYNKATEYLWGVKDIDLFLEHRVVEEIFKKSFEDKK